jgi:hypothetical protein
MKVATLLLASPGNNGVSRVVNYKSDTNNDRKDYYDEYAATVKSSIGVQLESPSKGYIYFCNRLCIILMQKMATMQGFCRCGMGSMNSTGHNGTI